MKTTARCDSAVMKDLQSSSKDTCLHVSLPGSCRSWQVAARLQLHIDLFAARKFKIGFQQPQSRTLHRWGLLPQPLGNETPLPYPVVLVESLQRDPKAFSLRAPGDMSVGITAAVVQTVGAEAGVAADACEGSAAIVVMERLAAILRRALEREDVVQDLHPQRCGLPLVHVCDGLDALELGRQTLSLYLERRWQRLLEDRCVAELHEGGEHRLLLPGARVVGHLVHVEDGAAVAIRAAQVAVSVHLQQQPTRININL